MVQLTDGQAKCFRLAGTEAGHLGHGTRAVGRCCQEDFVAGINQRTGKVINYPLGAAVSFRWHGKPWSNNESDAHPGLRANPPNHGLAS
ncbi:hypothetical protein GCM10010052_31010 [Paenarthrobacter histidinolovorans]|nr:hypothetical protein GCM10010052_31010 [Paenarthrobacter histidinolovorans]